MTEAEEMKQRLRARYTPEPVPPCGVCGAPLQIARAGGGAATEYACRDAKVTTAEGTEHYRRSRFTRYRPGDPDVLALLARVEKLEGAGTAWLIEWPADRQMPVRYWHPTEGHVLDPSHAVRFCRREDAEAMLKRDHLFGGARPVEHMWLARAALGPSS